MDDTNARVVWFGPFEFDLDEQRLTRDGHRVRLPPKTAAVLCVLVNANGRIVPKAQLMDAVWPNTFVEEGSLNFQINQLRQLLRDGGGRQMYVENVPRRGYRFAALIRPTAQARAPVVDVPIPTVEDGPVAALDSDAVPGSQPAPAVSRPHRRPWSSDGKQLVFGDVPETWGRPVGNEVLHLFDLERAASEPVAGSSLLWTSRWSPNGRYLIAKTIVGQHLMLFDIKTQTWRPLGVSHANHLSWSRDSAFVYCDPEGIDHTFRRVRIADGRVETLLDLGEHAVSWGGIDPNGNPLVLRQLADIYALELERR